MPSAAPRNRENALHLRRRAHHPLRGGALRRAEGRRERARRHSGERARELIPVTSGISLEAGEQTLDGDQASPSPARRHATRAGDFSRAQAQRPIIEDHQRRCSRSPSPRSRVPWSPSRCVTTDYSVTDLVSLALTFKTRAHHSHSACPSYTLNQDGISYVGTSTPVAGHDAPRRRGA